MTGPHSDGSSTIDGSSSTDGLTNPVRSSRTDDSSSTRRSSSTDGSSSSSEGPASRDGSTATARSAICVVCGAETELEGCCSVECAQRAEREIKRNAALLQRTGAGPTGEDRQRLAARNGRMLSALLRWRASNAPVSSDGEHHA